MSERKRWWEEDDEMMSSTMKMRRSIEVDEVDAWQLITFHSKRNTRVTPPKLP